MDDREQRRRQRREAVINEVIKKRSSSFWGIPGRVEDALPALVEEILDAQEKIESGDTAPVRQSVAGVQPDAAATAGSEPAAAVAVPEKAAPLRPVRTKSSEETMVFVIKTNAIRDKRKGGESDE
jgi:hypothetical protein